MTQDIQKLWDFLKGKKTYLISFAAMVYGWAIQQGLVQHNVMVDFLLAGGATASIRHGIDSALSDPAPAAPAAPISAATKVGLFFLCAAFAGAVMVGCAGDYGTSVFNSEKLLTDGAIQSTHAFNLYYSLATNGASAKEIEDLNNAKAQIYAADREMNHGLVVVDQLRLAYATNSSATNKAAIEIGLQVLSDQSTNVISLTKSIVK